MEIKYLVKEPLLFSEDTKAIFYIHGYGSNEEDLLAFSQDLPKDVLHVSFRGIFPATMGGFSWYDIDFNTPEGYFHKEQALQSLNALLEVFIEIKEKYGIKDGNIDLCGFSQGGVLSYALAFKNPQLFSKVVCMSSYPEEKLMNDIAIDKKKLHQLRFFISHGVDDAIIPLEWGRKAADMLYDLGCFFSFREYMYGHGINQKNYIDLVEFLNK